MLLANIRRVIQESPELLRLLQRLVAFAGLWAGKILLNQNKKAAIHFLTGGVLLGLVVPYTILVIKPKTSDYLLDPKVDKTSPKTTEMFETWSNLHLVRTLAASAAFLMFMKATILIG